MNTLVVACCTVLVIAIHSDLCFSLEYTLENSDNVKDVKDNGPRDLSSFETSASGAIEQKKLVHLTPITFVKFNEEIKNSDGISKEDVKVISKRDLRQQGNIYPNLAQGPQYGLAPYPSYNNQNPSNNSQWQNPYNQPQPGYPAPNNGYQQNYKNPYGSNTPSPNYNNPNGYNNVNNFTNYNPARPQQGPYVHPNPYQPYYPPNNNQNPLNSTPRNYPHNPYPSYQPTNNVNNKPSARPPYHQPGQFQNNSNSGYPKPGYEPVRTTPYPYQRPQYYPGQTVNNTGYPQLVPGNQYPVAYDSSLNSTHGKPPYSSTNGHNPQYFNSYPGISGYKPPNATNPYNGQVQPINYNPGQSSGYGTQNSAYPYNGQIPPSNSYPGQSSGATFNLANGYNPNIPNRPQYGGGSPYGNSPYGINVQAMYPNGTLHDPTKVSPGMFNSY